MCSTSFARLSQYISEREENISVPDRLKKGHRIPWNDITSFIVVKLCRVTLGSRFYLQVHTVMREDNEGFHRWCLKLKRIVVKVCKYGKGWEKVIDTEALHVLIDWITTQEERALKTYLIKKGMQDRHPTLTGMTEELTFSQFFSAF